MKESLKGQLTISRPQRSDGREYIQFSLIDKSSHTQAFEVRIPLAEFANAVTGLGAQDCEYDFNDSGVVGKTAEHKTVTIEVGCTIYSGKRILNPAIFKAMEPFEVDGWKGSIYDAVNSHRVREYGKDSYKVNVDFVRYV